MLKIHTDEKELARLADGHFRHLLPKIKARLKKRGARQFQSYFTDQKLEEILTCQAADLLVLHKKTMADLQKKVNSPILEKRLKAIFSHVTFFRKPDNNSQYSAFDICEGIELVTCPYCNLNLVTTIVKTGPRELVLRPPLDHFFPFSKYPLLALCFYNLVPSCWTCNSSFKLSKDCNTVSHLHPHVDGFGEHFQFTFWGANIDDILTDASTKFEVGLLNKNNDIRYKGNNELFHLETIYNTHKRNARRTLLLAKKYPTAEIASIKSLAQTSGLEVSELIFNTIVEETQLHERPFSKINRDIISQFGSAELKTELGL